MCAQSNAVCDEISNRLCQFLNTQQMMRIYSMSYDLNKISSTLKSYSNFIDGKLKYPSIKEMQQFRVVICTLSTSGCLLNAREDIYSISRLNLVYYPQPHYERSSKFDYLFIDECASAHETVSLIPICSGNEYSLSNFSK